jgi:hypothetical protein
MMQLGIISLSHIDPAAPRPIRARPAQPEPGPGMPALHQRDEIPAIHRRSRIDAQTRQGLRGRQPAARRLRQFPIGGEVVVPPLRRDRLALQIAGIATTPAGTNARSTHHPPAQTPNTPKRPTNSTAITQRPHPCASCVGCCRGAKRRRASGSAQNREDRADCGLGVRSVARPASVWLSVRPI